MVPKTYLDQYTTLQLVDPNTGGTVSVHITGYGSGWQDNVQAKKDFEERKKADPTAKMAFVAGNRGAKGPAAQREFFLFQTALQTLLHPEDKKHRLSGKINTENDEALKKAMPARYVAWNGLMRAFLGKGSPTEIADALTIAIKVGRVGTDKDVARQPCAAKTVQDYVDKFITLDCNALVGNILGANPSDSPGHYAKSDRQRNAASDVKAGDVVVTVNATGNHEHIAILDEFIPPKPDEKNPKCGLRLVEWGQAGDESKHYSQKMRFEKIKKGPKYGVGFESTRGFRYFFAAPENLGGPRARGLGGDATK